MVSFKHFERAIHLVRDMVTDLKMKLVFVRTTNQLADIFTKALGKTDFQRIRNRFLLCQVGQLSLKRCHSRQVHQDLGEPIID